MSDRIVEVADVLGNIGKASLSGWPTDCPRCHRTGMQERVSRGVVDDVKGGVNYYFVEVAFRCPSRECGRLSIAAFVSGKYVRSYPVAPRDPEIPAEVKSLSATFAQCYTEALAAETHQLSEVAGAGFRKALEFLVKDYCKASNPGKEKEIESKFLGACIEEFIEDSSDLKECAKRATWLGNDEVHYVRKWEGKDIQNLKEVLGATIYWVAMKLKTQAIVDSMPNGKN